MKLKHSQKGLTAFSMKFPVELTSNKREDQGVARALDDQVNYFQLIGNSRKISTQIKNYLHDHGYQSSFVNLTM